MNYSLFIVILMLMSGCIRSLPHETLENLKSKRIIFVRHAEQDWSYRMIWEGRKDPTLSLNGRKQASVLAKKLAPFGKNQNYIIYSSNTRRAMQTADIVQSIIASKRGVIIIKNLDERKFIDYSKAPYNITKEVIDKFHTDQDFYNYLRAYEKNNKLILYDKVYETQEDFNIRVMTAFNKLLKNHPADVVALIVTHKEVFKVLSKKIFNREISLKHAEAIFYNF